MYITAVMLLLLLVEKHSYAYLHTQVVMPVVPKANHDELKSFLLLPHHNSGTPWSPEGNVLWVRHTWVQISAFLLVHMFRDMLCNPLTFSVFIYKTEIIVHCFYSCEVN